MHVVFVTDGGAFRSSVTACCRFDWLILLFMLAGFCWEAAWKSLPSEVSESHLSQAGEEEGRGDTKETAYPLLRYRYLFIWINIVIFKNNAEPDTGTYFRTFEMILVAPCRSLVRIVELSDAFSVTARLHCVSNGCHHGIPIAPVKAIECAHISCF